MLKRPTRCNMDDDMDRARYDGYMTRQIGSTEEQKGCASNVTVVKKINKIHANHGALPWKSATSSPPTITCCCSSRTTKKATPTTCTTMEDGSGTESTQLPVFGWGFSLDLQCSNTNNDLDQARYNGFTTQAAGNKEQGCGSNAIVKKTRAHYGDDLPWKKSVRPR
mmetsp:Transcript_42095/g.72507  ORF Transcript_42095/g.72507 Transcript_42095/m.72507 type:complete len:166 (+) Transcript_42095:98-595(+)